jgi:hypothetical protein
VPEHVILFMPVSMALWYSKMVIFFEELVSVWKQSAFSLEGSKAEIEER